MQRTLFHILIWSFMAGITGSCGPQQQNPEKKWAYPETATVDQVDDYFGAKVSDPYRWLENDTAAAVESWVDAQNEVTFAHLAEIPFREQIRARLEQLWDYEKFSSPFKEGGKYYFFKNDGLQNQSVLYVQEDLDAEPEVFFDPNKLSEDGTVSLATFAFSNDAKYFAYATSESGSDWRTIYVMDIATGELLDDKVEWAKFTGISWYKNGFFYSMYDAPVDGKEFSSMNMGHKVYYHQLGTPQSEDELVFGGNDAQKVRYAFGYVTEDARYLVLSASISTTGNKLFIKDLSKSNNELVTVVDNFEKEHSVAHSEGTKLYISTNLDAPNNRVVTVDASAPQPENWVDIVPERKEVLRSASFAGGKMFLNYLQDATTRIYQHNLDGELEHEVELPALGSAGGFGGKMDEMELFYSFTSFTYPSTIYRYDVATGQSEVFRQAEVDFNPDDYETKQVFYTSKDGTKVPMFIVHRKGIQMDGSNPTYLYGYGGFNISLTPGFSITRLFWLEQGGIFAMPNLRGGGEYGEEWHLAGTKMQKQNVFDDFIAAGEYLIENKYTSKEKLAIFGGSNGGLLVGATMTQRPDLCQVAVPAVGVLDMLRYHKFTAGAGWIYDYGCADSSQAMFEYMRNYSPVHNVKVGTNYPATLVKTADHDDRVVPAHSFKFISELQAKDGGENPVLIRIDKKAGHGAGKPTSMVIDEWADTYAFVYYHLEEEPFESVQVVK